MDKKIKVLHISHSAYYNGAEITLFNIIKFIDKKMFEPVVVFPHYGPLVDKIRAIGVKTFIVPMERWIRFSFDKPSKVDIHTRIHHIIEIIENEKIDIVHTNTSVIFEGAIAAKLKNIPHIWHFHEYLQGHLELNSVVPLPIIYSIISVLSSKIISVSNFVTKQFEGITEYEKLVTIYNGVEKNNYLFDPTYFQKQFGFNKNDRIAVIVGILKEAKGYKNLIETALIIKNKGLNIKFLWIGGVIKDAYNDFKAKVKKLGLKETIFYLGMRDDISFVLRNSDFLICTSLLETLSLAVIEAMAAGLPVITTNCGGTSECVQDSITGYIVPVNDSVKLSEKIIELCLNENKRKLFGENGFKRFLEFFVIDKFIENVQNVFLEVLSNANIKITSMHENILIESLMKIYQDFSYRK